MNNTIADLLECPKLLPLRKVLRTNAREPGKKHLGLVDSAPAQEDELAVMAETLVSLTSFKRKMSRDAETVGGDIDVAVISKGDGYIWVKRKHYFPPELNLRYLKRIEKEQI
jgi:hypothetical protein